MPVRRFPDPSTASPEGIVAIGGDLEPATLMAAYRGGIFPWPVEGCPLLWFSPERRGVLEFDRLRVPRSLAQARRRSKLRFTFDRAFEQVIRGCAQTPRPGQPGTWITPGIVRGYTRLSRQGHAHSVEAWDGERLVGGVYGVDVDGAFSAESMFYRVSNASKLALLELVDRLRAGGLDWMDIEVVTPHMARLGAREIPRAEFLARLARTRARGLRGWNS
jgi:leucyl/phenylalanyl-tRNA--protein transferase